MTLPVIGYRAWHLREWRDDDVRVGPQGRERFVARRYRRDPALDEWMGRVSAQTMALPLSVNPLHRDALRVAWRGGPNRFWCFRGHEQPTSKCVCGLHAWGHPGPISKGSPRVIRGAVIAWGHLVLHGAEVAGRLLVEGFRAEWAQPVALVRPRPGPKLDRVAALAESWGVPLVAFRDLERVAREFGVPLSEAL